MRSKLKGRRPSPAMVLAVIALVVALAGTSVASIATISKLSGKTVKKNSLPGNRVKKNTVTGKQVKESSLGEVPKAQNAVSANNATTANGPIGWARVSSTGVVLASRNVSQGNVTPGSADYWCFSGLGFSFRGLQVTVDYWNGTQFFDTIAQASVPGVGNSNLGGTGCSANTQAFVTGKRGSNGATSPIGFFITFYN